MTAKAIAVCLLVLPAAAAAASGGACLGKVSGALKNGGFESTPQSAMSRGMTPGSYSDNIPEWTCRRLKGICDECGTVDSAYGGSYDTCIINSNAGSAFGSMDSGGGDNYFILHGRVAGVQTVSGLKAGSTYTISYLMAERYGYGNGETLRLTVDGEVLVAAENAPQAFTAYSHTFTASSEGGDIEIEFANISPHKDSRDGHTIFLDSVQITEPAESCGTGAECHAALDSSDGYVCKCNGRGYVGHDAKNKAAKCVDVTTLGGSDDALAEKVKVLQEEMAAVESAVGSVQVQSKGLGRSVETTAADIIALQSAADGAEAARNSTDAALSNLQDALSKAQGDIAGLQAQLNEVVAANGKLVAALKATAAVPVPEVAAEPTADTSFAPEVTGDAGGINLVVQPGRHATVNDEVLLTADEVRSMIASAVADALKAVGNAA